MTLNEKRHKDQPREVKREELLETSVRIMEGMENVPEMTVIASSVFLMVRQLMISLNQRKYF